MYKSKLDPITLANKDIAEAFLGYQHGRPTISHRVARPLSRALGCNVGTAKDIFHVALFVAGIAAVGKLLAPKPPGQP